MVLSKAVIIGNPNSGSAGDKDYLERLAEILRTGGLDTDVLNTEYPNHAMELASIAGDRIVIAAGGDGTVNEVLNGLSDGATLGILPFGTANVLAREIGLPLDAEDACTRILTGEVFQMDVGVATDSEGKKRRFACMAGIGFDAEVIGEVGPRLKRYLRSLAFPIAALKIYFRGGQPELRVADGSTTHSAQFVIIANGRYYGGELKTAEDASLANGELEVVLVEKVRHLLRLGTLARILLRKPLDRTMRSFSSQCIRVEVGKDEEASVPVQIDGEVWEKLPMSFRIESATVNVIR